MVKRKRVVMNTIKHNYFSFQQKSLKLNLNEKFSNLTWRCFSIVSNDVCDSDGFKISGKVEEISAHLEGIKASRCSLKRYKPIGWEARPEVVFCRFLFDTNQFELSSNGDPKEGWVKNEFQSFISKLKWFRSAILYLGYWPNAVIHRTPNPHLRFFSNLKILFGDSLVCNSLFLWHY